MTHQSVLADFIPLKRKGDAGRYWHLEMAVLSLPTTTQNILCTAVSDRQLVLKSTVPSLYAESRGISVSTRGNCGKQTLIPKLAIMVFTGSVLQRTNTVVLKLMFDISQTNHSLSNSEVSDFFHSITQQNSIDNTNNRFF